MANIIGGALAGAAIVLAGGLYAVLLAYGRVRGSRLLIWCADAAFGALVLGAVGLAFSLRLNGLWIALPVALLIGYRFAPAAIWRLSVATRADRVAADEPAGRTR